MASKHRRKVAGRGIDDPPAPRRFAGLLVERSRVSVISRAFSIAMTACAAKFCNNAICLSEKRTISVRKCGNDPEQLIALVQSNKA